MSQDTEAIEARLAGYIDGTLPPKEHAEIERFLLANPQHRQLIEELKILKQSMRDFPQEHAPLEVMDHLQTHLERGALLDDVGGPAPVRVSRWPQFTAAAAVVLLTASLGILIYKVLPGGTAPGEIAMQSENQLPSLREAAEEPATATTNTAATDPIGVAPLAKSAPAAPIVPAPIDGITEQTVRERDLARAEEAAAPMALRSVSPAATQPNHLFAAKEGETPPAGEMADQVAALQQGQAASRPADDLGAVETQIMAFSSTDASSPAIEIVTDDAAITQGLVAGELTQRGIDFTVNKNPANKPATLPSIIPEGMVLVAVPAVTPAQFEELKAAFSLQRAGRQQVRQAPLTPVTTAPTTDVAPSDAATTQPATQPATMSLLIVIRHGLTADPATQPATQPTTEPVE
jgi:hypothetical protein